MWHLALEVVHYKFFIKQFKIFAVKNRRNNYTVLYKKYELVSISVDKLLWLITLKDT